MATLADAVFKPRSGATEQKLTETAAGLLAYVPFFASLFYELKVMWVPKDHPRIWAMATDGTTVYINEHWFVATPLPERAFVLCHEILHCMFDDMTRAWYYRKLGTIRGLTYHDAIANHAQDYRINAVLVASKIGKLPQQGLYNLQIAAPGETFEVVYERLFQKYTIVPIAVKGIPGALPGESVDGHLVPDHTRTPAEEAQRKQQWQQAIKAATAAAKAVGNMPGALEQLVNELLEAKVRWQDELRKYMQRAVRGYDHRNWKRLRRRTLVFDPQIIMPGRTGFGAEEIVCVFDTSGSMGEKEFKHTISEAASILTDIHPRTLWVIQGDAGVADVKRLPEGTGVRSLMYRKGFGGTDFRPPFIRVREMGIRPDVLVYFTDLYGPFPTHPPGYPVIWAATSNEPVPWGKVIRIDVSGN